MVQKVIQTDQAPAPKGPYSQAIKTQNLLFIAGQIPINLTTSEIEGKTTAEQARVVLKHIKAILKASNLNFSNVVKTEVFLTNIADTKEMNEVYSEFFDQEPRPARQTIEVSKLPMNSKIEISCIASFEG